MPERWHRSRLAGRRLSQAELRQERIYTALSRPRTQSELRDMLGLSNSGIRGILRRMQAAGLVRSAERVAHTQIWERSDVHAGPDDRPAPRA